MGCLGGEFAFGKLKILTDKDDLFEWHKGRRRSENINVSGRFSYHYWGVFNKIFIKNCQISLQMSIVDLLQTALTGGNHFPPLSDSEQKRRIEQNLRKISDGRLPYSGNPNAYGLFEGFRNWASFAESI